LLRFSPAQLQIVQLHGQTISKETKSENSFNHCALSTWTFVYSLWAERLSQFHPSATADEPACYPVLPRHQCVTFCRVLLRGAVDWRVAFALGLLCALALTLLAAEIYNILAFHLTLAPASIAPALVASVLWVLVFLQYRANFKDVLAAKPAVQQ
jgi:hypothetical protein